jgi:hypothetical protein
MLVISGIPADGTQPYEGAALEACGDCGRGIYLGLQQQEQRADIARRGWSFVVLCHPCLAAAEPDDALCW